MNPLFTPESLKEILPISSRVGVLDRKSVPRVEVVRLRVNNIPEKWVARGWGKCEIQRRFIGNRRDGRGDWVLGSESTGGMLR